MSNRKDWMIAGAYGELSEELLETCAREGLACVEFHHAQDFSAIANWSKNTGVRIWSRHLPFGHENIGHRTAERVVETVELYKKCIEQAALAGASNVIIHPSGEPNEEEVRAERMERCINAFSQLVEHAKQYNITVCCENLPRTCLCRDSDECMKVVESVPGLKLCFDTNHLLKENHKDFIRKVGKYIQTTHVSDYDFVDERHWLPLGGKINWKELIEELELADFKGPFLYETGYDPKSIYTNAMQLFAL